MKTITVAKGLCSPARSAITRTLRPYGVKIHHINEYNDGEMAAYMNAADVTVNDAAAAWTEYLLLRSGRFQLLSKPIDPRNEAWALKWDKKMPQPWIENGCDPKNPIAAAVDAIAKPIRRQRAQRQPARTQRRPERKERY